MTALVFQWKYAIAMAMAVHQLWCNQSCMKAVQEGSMNDLESWRTVNLLAYQDFIKIGMLYRVIFIRLDVTV